MMCISDVHFRVTEWPHGNTEDERQAAHERGEKERGLRCSYFFFGTVFGWSSVTTRS